MLSLGNNFDDPKTQGLLSLGLGLLGSRGGFAESLSSAGMGAMGVYQQAQQRQQIAKARAMQQQAAEMQMQQAQRAMAEQEAMNAWRQTLPNRSPADPMQQAMTEGMKIGAVPLNAWLGMQQPKEVEIKEYREIRMPDGSVQVVGFGKDGKPVNTGQTPFKAPEVRDFGGSVGGIDPITGRVTSYGNKTQTPDGVASQASAAAGRAQSAAQFGAGQAQAMTIAQMADDRARDRGTNPNSRTGPMSVTMQKELLESDDVAQSAASVVRTLAAAKAQNATAYSGYFAKSRATAMSNTVGSAAADATIDIDNMMTGQALESLKVIFGGMPTEGERKILLEMQASVDKTPKQREAIMDRASAAAQRRGVYARSKAKAIRDGSYLTDGVPAPPASGGQSLDELLKKY